MSQTALAVAADLHQPRVSTLEAGKGEWTLGELNAVASALGVPLEALFPSSAVPALGPQLTDDELRIIDALRRGQTVDAVELVLAARKR